MKRIPFTAALLSALQFAFIVTAQNTPAASLAPYPGWQHSGALTILTTPEGANLPASALETDFPLLVRLDKDWFAFSQAKTRGEDIRFASSTGTPLAYQIEEWDAAKGKASIWVRIPQIKGNQRQQLKLHWGNADAASESKGSAVFNADNGYVTVLHMDGALRDELDSLTPKDQGTTTAAGLIGEASTKAKALVEFSTWRRDWVRRRHGFLPEIYFWIDYCCFDQGNSSINMAMLPVWIASCERVLCIETHDYHERAWCRLELLLSYAFNFADHYTVIDPAFQASASHDGREETHILKRPIVGCLTDPSDAKHIEALEQLACGFQPASIDRVSGRRLPLAEFDTTPVRCYRL